MIYTGHDFNNHKEPPVQLMPFYNALMRASYITVDGEPVSSMGWEDDGEEGMALRVLTKSHNILVYATDKISRNESAIIVSISSTDHEFVLK